MQSFLHKVAGEVLDKHKNNLKDVVVVLPTRRACLFFRKHLSEQITSPAWAPEIVAINDFILSVSAATVPDDLELVAELYSVFTKYFPGESFDSFYPWGKMLLKDFDEVDRWLVPAEKIFATLSGMKNIDEQFGLSPEQQEEVRQFAETFFAHEQSEVKKEFSGLWNKVFIIYSDFRKVLQQGNLAYEGMAYRQAAEKISDADFLKSVSENHFVFAGFYALSASEEKIIHTLRDNNLVQLYWDSDEYYFSNPVHEAGHFLRNNQLIGKNNFEWNGNYFSGEKKNIRIIGIPLQVGQTKTAGVIVKQILKDNSPGSQEKTAVVLPDERMLLPLLQSIPLEAEQLNVTMGYPLSQSPLFLLVDALFNLFRHVKGANEKLLFYHKYVKEILLHPYITSLEKEDSEKLFHELEEAEYVYVPLSLLAEKDASAYRKIIFSNARSAENIFTLFDSLIELLLLNSEHAKGFSSLDVECIAVFFARLSQLKEIVVRKMPQIETGTLWNLILEIIRSEKIPFSGEPLSGLQVMGFLETRALDFENVIVLNMNEGTLPSSSRNGSFIPFIIRKSFGLPVFTEQDAISSYHFYRLLQRAKNIFLLYDTEVKKLATGEKSRFILQILHELKEKAIITEELITAPVLLHDVKPIAVEKDVKVMNVLNKYLITSGKEQAANKFSASGLSAYINCPLQFYFRYVAGLKKEEDMTDEIDDGMFGTLLHNSIHSLYSDKKNLTESVIASLEQEITETVSSVFTNEITQKAKTLFGKNLLMKRAIEELVNKILDADKASAPIEILMLERRVTLSFRISESQTVSLYGIIDRVDKVNGITRLLDYKTGKVKGTSYRNVEDLFTDPKKKEIFQLMFYVLFYYALSKGELPAAGLYVLRDISDGVKYINDNSSPVAEESFMAYKDRLVELFSEILNPKIPFVQTEDNERCTYCDFKDICMR